MLTRCSCVRAAHDRCAERPSTLIQGFAVIFGTHQKAERLKGGTKHLLLHLKSECCDLDMGNSMESKKALKGELREGWSWASLKDAQNHLKSH